MSIPSISSNTNPTLYHTIPPHKKSKSVEYTFMRQYGTPAFGMQPKDYIKHLQSSLHTHKIEKEIHKVERDISLSSPKREEQDHYLDSIDSLGPLDPNCMEFPARCPECFTHFETNQEYKNHLHSCKIFQYTTSHKPHVKNKGKQIANELPTYDELFKRVCELEKQQSRMDGKLQQMYQWFSQQKRKPSIAQWLKQNVVPETTFHKWVATLQVGQKDIDFLYDHTYYDTVANTFKRHLPLKQLEQLPIRAFEQRKGYLYIYDSGIKLRTLKFSIKETDTKEEDRIIRWYCLPISKFEGVLNKVFTQYYSYISNLMKETQEDESTDTIKLMKMIKKIGQNSNKSPPVSQIMNKIHKHLKENGKYITGT